VRLTPSLALPSFGSRVLVAVLACQWAPGPERTDHLSTTAEIPEADYPTPGTLDGCVDYLAAATAR